MLKVGILGLGYMGAIRQRVLEAREDCEVTRIFHTEPGYAATWQEVVDAPELDAVFVCLPTHMTCAAVCRALERGKHVFAEKPPGGSSNEVRAMMAAQEAASRVLEFGFNHRLHPAIRAAHALVQSGDLGTLNWLRGRYGKPFDEASKASWRGDPAQAGGGILLDQGIHMLDLFLMLCGPFDEVHAFASTTHSAELEDDVMVVMRNARGQLASLHSSHTQWAPTFSLELGLSAGSIEVQGLLTRSGRYGPESLTWGPVDAPRQRREVYEVDDSWALEVGSFVEAIAQGRVSSGSTSQALIAMQLVESIYAAAGRTRGVH